MAHFSSEVWIDYIRGVGTETLRADLEEHLDAECAECRSAQASFRRMARLLEAEERAGLPEAAVRSVKAVFGLERGLARQTVRSLDLDLVFDSAVVLAHPGTRSAGERARSYLFESEDYSLDVRLDRERESNDLLVLGQLLRSIGEPVTEAAAYLMAGGAVAAAAVTGEFGSFTLRTSLEPPINLCLFPDEAHRIAVEVGGSSGRAERG